MLCMQERKHNCRYATVMFIDWGLIDKFTLGFTRATPRNRGKAWRLMGNGTDPRSNFNDPVTRISIVVSEFILYENSQDPGSRLMLL